MFLTEPPATQFDARFTLLGIPVRISVFFWVATLLLGWNGTFSAAQQPGAPPQSVLLVLWALAILVSILIHEFGHALAFRAYGRHSHVVLYHFGGLAIADERIAGRNDRTELPANQIIVSAAGPAVQLVLAAAIIGVLVGLDRTVPVPFAWLDRLVPQGSQPLPSEAAKDFVLQMLWINIGWALVNLLPIYPLDGGRIARELFSLWRARDGIRYSLILSIISGIAVALYAFQREQQFLGLMFGLLAFSSYTALQAYQGRGYGSWRGYQDE